MAETTEEGPRSFAVFLRSLKSGQTEAELSEALQSLCSQVQDAAIDQAGKAKGKLTLTLEISVQPNGVASIIPLVTTKLPTPRREECLAWVSPKGGNVVFEPPRQQKLPLHEVPAPARTAEVSTLTTSKEA